MDQEKSTCKSSNSKPRERNELEMKDPVGARKIQKAGREKLRRNRLNEVFSGLGNTLDPDRPKNDKATIVSDTIQTLRDLTDEVRKLKAECATLSDESCELTKEKNELRAEKASLQSEVDNLNVQWQQRHSVMYPWGATDHTLHSAPPYSFPVALPMPPSPVPVQPFMQPFSVRPYMQPFPVQPSRQPFPFFGNENSITISAPTCMPYSSQVSLQMDEASTEHRTTLRLSNNQESSSKSLDSIVANSDGKDGGSSNVVTELELKLPGPTAQQELSTGDRKGKRPQQTRKISTDGSSSSSRYCLQDCNRIQASDATPDSDIPGPKN